MQKYLIETHCHTDETSNCGKMPAKELVRLYHSLGYNGVMISDHLHNYTFKTLKNTIPEPSWDDKIEYFIKGYKEALKEAKNIPDFKVYLGAELRFDENDNDYLIFGLSEDKLKKMEGIIEMRPKKALKFIKSLDCCIIQAHPFRNDCVIMDPEFLDGIEVFNGHTTDSRNDIAFLWAEKFSFIRMSGSDFHGGGSPNAGIFTDKLPESEDELRDLILYNSFDIKTSEDF